MAQKRPRRDGDSRSAVSSFYGAQSNANDSAPYGSHAGAKDSQFFGRNGEDYNPQQLQYESDPLRDREGYYSPLTYPRPPDAIEPVKGGMDEELGQGAGWDVYADFNNAGPRYSSVPFTAAIKSNDGYRPLKPPEPLSSMSSKRAASSTYEPQVELVTVPAMGPEWSAQELADMKQSTKRQRKTEERKRAWRAFKRDQKGLCGIPYLTRTRLVWISFISLLTLGLLLFFLIPRAPNFSFAFGQPLVGNGGPTPYFNAVPTNFSFTGNIDLQADTHGSYVPTHFKNISASIYSSETSKLVATGSWGPGTLRAKAYVPVMINVTFSYSAINTSDVTWNIFHDACKNVIQYANATRPGLNIRLILEMDIVGLIGMQGTSTLIENAPCPIMLPANAG